MRLPDLPLGGIDSLHVPRGRTGRARAEVLTKRQVLGLEVLDHLLLAVTPSQHEQQELKREQQHNHDASLAAESAKIDF